MLVKVLFLKNKILKISYIYCLKNEVFATNIKKYRLINL